MVRREVVSSDGKISDSTVAANDIQVDRNIGVNVSGVKLVRDLLVQATDEMEYVNNIEAVVYACFSAKSSSLLSLPYHI